jgi:phosphoenolpyruvate carboxylase
MATQHPDNADKYITIQQEPDEAIECLLSQEEEGLGIEEIMIDFEGKLTPYHQTSQIVLGLLNKGIIPGKDVLITPRIPNTKKEPMFRQLMSIMSLVETNILAYASSKDQAIIETIVPMIETGHEVIQIQERINSVIELGNKNYDIKLPLNSIRVIPLVEDVPSIVSVVDILDEYYKDSIEKGLEIDNIRIMFARSDSAMSYGMVSSVLSLMIGISSALKWGEDNNVTVAPILGCGSLPFRGHLTENTVNEIFKTYAGVKTFTVQSGLRYDHDRDSVKMVINTLKENMKNNDKRVFSDEDIIMMKEFIGIFTKYYMRSFLKSIKTVESISSFIPKNRDRLSGNKKGLEYIREIADMDGIIALVSDETLKKELSEIEINVECAVPRAISFTASMYTLGLPPEFMGVGRALEEISNKFSKDAVDKLLEFYPMLKTDLTYAAKYVNVKISKGILFEEARKEYIEDFEKACQILGIESADEEIYEDELYHTLLKSTRPIILHLLGKQNDLFDDSVEEQKILNDWIIKMGRIRGSLG